MDTTNRTYKTHGMKRTVFAVVVAAAAALGVAGMLFWNPTPTLGADEQSGIATLRETAQTFAAIAERTSPAVVNIQVEREMRARASGPRNFQFFGDPDFFERFFGFPFPQVPGPGEGDGAPRVVPFGQGSGFIISEDGYIVTNHHVVGQADKVRVTLLDGREFEAKIVGTDPPTEIALIKIDAKGLPTLPLGDSDAVKVGDWALAIGNPFGLSHTVTAGIISARGRSNIGIVGQESGGVGYEDFIQTDAAINPGNSGGPLVNLDGQVIGVNTAIVTRSGGYQGIGFAIPINMVKYVTKELREKGSVTRGYLGVWIQDMSPEMAEWFGTREGIVVSTVEPDSPAGKAGLQKDDVIVEIDGNPVKDTGTFRAKVATTSPGSKINLTVLRGGERKHLTVTVGGKESTQLASAQPSSGGAAGLGISVQNLTGELAQQFGYENEKGVVITQVDPNSDAARKGVSPGMLIIEVNRQPVRNTAEFERALQQTGGKQSVLLRIKDQQGTRYVAIRTN